MPKPIAKISPRWRLVMSWLIKKRNEELEKEYKRNLRELRDLR
jgi:hypothetical protein